MCLHPLDHLLLHLLCHIPLLLPNVFGLPSSTPFKKLEQAGGWGGLCREGLSCPGGKRGSLNDGGVGSMEDISIVHGVGSAHYLKWKENREKKK